VENCAILNIWAHLELSQFFGNISAISLHKKKCKDVFERYFNGKNSLFIFRIFLIKIPFQRTQALASVFMKSKCLDCGFKPRIQLFPPAQ
jgi:hypothetical protein